ncbi:endolytic transglycosylase MltG [Candidatus Saccharibacteria bacterium]|nr:endolytic transglycosylase MltG [Candidatus Saccharibacteria bacterium]
MRVIGLDVGEKRIGVAKADSSTRIAVPVGFVEVNGTEWQELDKIARLNSTNFFVVGLPRSNEGNETAQSLYARNFAKKLTEMIPGAHIRFQDESLTSVVAEERLKARKKKYEKGDIDTEAATIILQDFLEGYTVSMESNPIPAKPISSEKSGKVENVKAAVVGASETVTNITKKEADKVKLKTKKAKHKMKKATKWTSAIIILVIMGLLVTGATMFVIREIRRRERQEYYAEQERKMEEARFNFTIKPGETVFDIKKNLLALGYSNEEVEEAFDTNYNYSFLKDRPKGATLEGYLFGETHEFYDGTPVKDILKKYLDGMNDVINKNHLKEAYEKQGLSLFEGITLASIVQKEAPSSDQPTVAQIFMSRLENGIFLGSDVTVSYALDVVDPERTTYQDNQSALTIDSCYNTRNRQGLPCGPISNPGLSALLAVANPSDTTYLYFLTGDDGVMYYSYTEEQHIQNIYSHCQNLCNASL